MNFKVFDCLSKNSRYVELDELVARITEGCIGDNWEFEAVKAVAVIARTELARKTNIYGGKGCELNNSNDICTMKGHCIQGSFHNSTISKTVLDAVIETKNKIITFEGRPIKPFYHFRCGGTTENSENVIGHKITYLRKVLCSYCKDIKDKTCEGCFTVEELEKLLATKMHKPDNVYNSIKGMFEDIETDEQGRVRTIKIGNNIYKGTDVMKILNLNSTRFNYTPLKFRFNTIGEGHGLGLCQCGANVMAKQGMNFIEILKYYYTGIELEEMEMPEADRPLKGRKFVIDPGHGGENCCDGKGASGLREKDVNLEIALELAELLEKEGAAVVLTRSEDKNIPLSDRAIIANESKPDFFISILQNSFPSAGVSGTEIYHFRGDKESEVMSSIMIKELCESLKTKNRGVRIADFYLLREIRASSIIIQLLYISNPEDERKLLDRDFRKNAAKALFNSIIMYYSDNKKAGN